MPQIAKTKEDGVKLRQRIEELYVKGASQCQIAEAIGISQPRVNTLLQEIRREWLNEGPSIKQELVVELQQRYRWIFFEANKAWERSKKNKTEITVEEPLLGMMKELGKNGLRKKGEAKDELRRLKSLGRKTTKTNGRIPAAQFLQIMNDVNKALREMHGIDAPQKIQAQVATASWAEITQAARDKDKPTPEQIIEQLVDNKYPDAVEANEYEGTEFEQEQS